MKKAITLFAIVISFSAFARNIVEQNVGDFSELKVFDLIEVNLIPSSENKVVITGDNSESVRILNEDGVLKLRMKLDERFDGNRTFIEIHYTKIETLDANEGAVITAANTIEQESIALRSQEGGKIKVGLKVHMATIKAVTGGIVEASGLAQNQNIKLNTGGIFEGQDLKTQSTNVKITAAGEAKVNASEKVNAKVTAGGNVYVYGNPKEVNGRETFGGNVEIMN